MGCLRVTDLCSYLVEPLSKTLQDADAYVRKNAVMCVPKVYEIDPNLVEKNNLITVMKSILEKDKNPIVIANTITSLAEINTLRPVKIKILTKSNLDNVLTALNEATGTHSSSRVGPDLHARLPGREPAERTPQRRDVLPPQAASSTACCRDSPTSTPQSSWLPSK